ncbi:dipeptidyl aminopeptidase/acylaminoacyl peptidase [Sphingomonas sp. PP-F2F-A104-K0414]|uniref:S9 family peptidase n=1 Tax=Sphingomonas sp. PP-F2F-A104-K0414 TaxID=2135661 RepID=UPI0010EFB103|nr:S9 family peptidase [Sphingomonas sp. PP-F2F-A104-K0414]TCP97433.1 dipeptidyl aminopeptidase/acylaminoacyl peptidase [Sphingomonas sp. PP-F2F-A104-K0414]
MTLPPLIPRRDIFGNPERSGAGISPDGEWLCWIAPVSGVMNLWIAPRDRPDNAMPITDDTNRGIDNYGWSYDSRYLLFSKDRDGDENWHVYAVPVTGGPSRDLTPLEDAQCGIAAISRHLPTEILVTSNARDPSFADLVRIDLDTGVTTVVVENPGFAFFICDDWFVPRIAVQNTMTGTLEILRPNGDEWSPWMTFSPEDARSSGPSHLDAAGKTLYFLDSRGRDKTALMQVALDDAEPVVMAQDDRADIGGLIADIDTYRPLAYSVTYEHHEYVVLDEAIRSDIEFLDAADVGDWSIMSQSNDNRWWTIGANSDLRPGRAYLYDRQGRTLTQLYESRPALARATLAQMHAVTIPSRDGLPLVCYLTLPPTGDAGGATPRTLGPQPLVLSVHGGPWTRDTFGFNGEHQWLANRGYAVLNVNFRGSSGLGKTFLSAGDLEWGARMDDDLSDAVAWAVDAGIADPDRIAIMGGSYGGYATLAALTRNPDKYCCGIDIVGPSNLETLLGAIPPYWETERAKLYRAIGDPRTDKGKALLYDRSPMHRAGDIRRPLLIGQGANDPRVKQAESDQMVAAMEQRGVPVTYVVYPDEGHGFHRPPNQVSFNAIVEAFLARHLGGRLEPVAADEVAGATYELRGDAAWLETLLPERD